MPLSRSQVESFLGDLVENFQIKPPRMSRRRQVQCRFGAKTLHLGRAIDRATLAHELAHYFHREFAFASDGAGALERSRSGILVHRGKGQLGRIHGQEWNHWRMLLGHYIAREFGAGEGVTL